MPGSPLALVVTADVAVLAADGGGPHWSVPLIDAPAHCAALDVEVGPRWVWWAARDAAAPLVELQPGLRLRRCWDLAAIHRLQQGGWADDAARVWAAVKSLDANSLPRGGQLDLLDPGGAVLTTAGLGDDDGTPADPVRPDGHLRPDWAAGSWATSPDRALRWAQLALEVAAHQRANLAAAASVDTTGPVLHTAWSESAAELLCVELARDGLPVDRGVAESVIGAVAGRRPRDEGDAKALRAERDAVVLATAPRSGRVDLRSPAQVKTMLAQHGFDLPDTRSWRLEQHAGEHPLVDALLEWRKAERIATTYGYRWLDQHLGDDGRLRGAWSGSDGGAGRMTAQAGLHSMPPELRVAVVAEPGHRFVRADLGQVEPRVLAAVSGDPSLARAARADDLYADVAAALRCERPVAKIAVLAAMYGQTSGTAGEALKDMERAYPVAMRHLQKAHDDGRAGRDVFTFGGRRVRMWPVDPVPEDAGEALLRPYRAVLAGRSRFARNAVVQGSAAELFKAWTATVRARLANERTGTVVLCLHDELLLHVRAEAADQVAREVVTDLESTAARWSTSGVRFVADVTVVDRWSDAKG